MCCHWKWLFVYAQMSTGDLWVTVATVFACSLPVPALPGHGPVAGAGAALDHLLSDAALPLQHK